MAAAHAPLRRGNMSSMMAMLDAKPEAKGGSNADGEPEGLQQQQQQYWSEGGEDQLSPLRKHLISTYLQVSDEDAMPLLSEYFGVALSFVALGALVRASNASRKHRKQQGMSLTEEETLDLRACSRFERMALESMLKESMERLGNLSHNAYQLEARVRDLVDEAVARDSEKVELLQRAVDADKVVMELRALRKAEGKANERVMAIVAAKEQDWLKEKRSLQKEVEKLKETVNGMTREAKFQARRCRNPTCEHCKGIDKAVRTMKGRISLRELHGLRDSQQQQQQQAPSSPTSNGSGIGNGNGNGKREAPLKISSPPPEIAPTSEAERLEMEEDRVLIKALELKKKHKEHQNKIDRLQSRGSDGASSSSSSSSSPPSPQSPPQELLLKQQQDMESELASILKRVGMLKQKSYPDSAPGSSTSEEKALPGDNDEAPEAGIPPNQKQGEEKAQSGPIVSPEPNMHEPTLEAAASPSAEDESADLDELEKAFELRADEDDSSFTVSLPEENLPSNNAAEVSNSPPETERPATDPADHISETSTTPNEQQLPLPAHDDPLPLPPSPSSEDSYSVPLLELDNESNPAPEEEEGRAAGATSETLEPAHAIGDGEASSLAPHSPTEADTDALPGGEGGALTDAPASPSAEGSSSAEEQVVGVVGVAEDEDANEFSDALSEMSEERDPSSSGSSSQGQPEHDDAGYDAAMDQFKESWGFEDPVAGSEEGELMENQDIPVFERNDIDDDLAGELPEPEEKRVCGLETTNELASAVKEPSRPASNEKDIASIEAVDEENLFVEKGGVVADAKRNSEGVIVPS